MRFKTLIILFSFLSVVILLLPTFWFSYPVFEIFFSPTEASGLLEVNFLDVGQGDATLVRTPFGQNILIDGGPGRAIIKELSKSMSFWDRTIDLMILSHPHDDHVSGLVEVLKRYRVKEIVYSGAVHTGSNYLAWLDKINNDNIPITIIDRRQDIVLGEDCKLEVIYPLRNIRNEDIELNDTSVVIKLVYKGSSFLFTGDIEESVERELLGSAINFNSDVLKVAHHGSDTSSLEEFLNVVSPAYAVVFVGKDNKFNHPSLRVIKRLERLGTKIYRTDIDSSIKFISDGENIWLK